MVHFCEYVLTENLIYNVAEVSFCCCAIFYMQIYYIKLSHEISPSRWSSQLVALLTGTLHWCIYLVLCNDTHSAMARLVA